MNNVENKINDVTLVESDKMTYEHEIGEQHRGI